MLVSSGPHRKQPSLGAPTASLHCPASWGLGAQGAGVGRASCLPRPLSWVCRHHPLPMSSHGGHSVRVWDLKSSSGQGPRHLGSGSSLGTSLYLTCHPKDPVSKHDPILQSWGLGLPHLSLG